LIELAAKPNWPLVSGLIANIRHKIAILGIPPMGLATSATAMKQDADVTAVLSGAFPPLGVF
jgi:hypothetical protein